MLCFSCPFYNYSSVNQVACQSTGVSREQEARKMATDKRKSQEKWTSTTPEEHAKSHPEGKSRERPGEGGKGEYYRIEVRPKTEFETFRYHDVGGPGHIQRLAGQRSNGSWDDQAWLISKKDAHVEDHFLKADSEDAKNILEIYGPAHQIEGDIFLGHPHRDEAGSGQPTGAQKAWEKKADTTQAAHNEDREPG